MHKNIPIFFQFLARDFYTYKSRAFTYIINYCLIYPALFAISIGYIQSNVLFGANTTQSSTLFIGHILTIMLVVANILNIGLLFDLENNRFIDYQIMLLPPRLVLFERIIFASLFTFLITLPFFPVAKLILGDSFTTNNASWLMTYLILYVGSLCCAAYTLFVVCTIKSSRTLRSFWMRINFSLITFGGLFIPWMVTKKFSSILGYLILLNPLLYITEGLRSAILNDPQYIQAPICIAALLVFSIFFTLLAWHYFKKRVDHI